VGHLDRGPAKPLRERGATLAIVLWAVVVLGAMALAAAASARIETVLQSRYRDHAAALALAEAGLAEVQATIARDATRASVADSVSGALATGTFVARWAPTAGRVHVVARGRAGRSLRRIEAWVDPVRGVPVIAWRETW